MSQTEQSFGFAPEDDAPIPYMQRIRDYYLALGYATPYRWAHYARCRSSRWPSRSVRAASP
jgi:hypothetical protein